MIEDKELLARIGSKIRKIREGKDMKQADLAARCNYESGNMSRIESGKSNISAKTLYRISQALGVKMSDVVDVE